MASAALRFVLKEASRVRGARAVSAAFSSLARRKRTSRGWDSTRWSDRDERWGHMDRKYWRFAASAAIMGRGLAVRGGDMPGSGYA